MKNYYDQNAQSFIDTTLNLEMSSLYTPFCERLEKNASVLDIGCGPGRDIKYFNEQGFQAQGIEPSSTLATFASEYTSSKIYIGTLESFPLIEKFDGIWACASLLHIPSLDLANNLQKIVELMKPGAIFYCSFKYGDFEGERNGRFFNDQTSESISKYMPKELVLIKDWITEDKRPDRSESWLNMIYKK